MVDPAHTNYYDVLGVAQTATSEDVRSAFLKFAAEYHAQGKPPNIEAVERFRGIVRAYHVLGNEEQRSRYDRLGEAGVDPAQITSGYDPEKLEQFISTPHLYPLDRWNLWELPIIVKDIRILSDISKD